MKRFTGTEKWDKEWFQRLSTIHKCLWFYLCDKCDGSGVWDTNFRLASFQIGVDVAEDDMKYMEHRVELLENGKYFLPEFVEFQCGKLSKDCKPHEKVIEVAIKNGIAERLGYPIAELPKGIHRVSDTLQEEEKEEEEDRKGGTGGISLSSQEKFIRGKELEQVTESLKNLKASYSEHQDYSREDKIKRKAWTKRKVQLEKLLGYQEPPKVVPLAPGEDQRVQVDKAKAAALLAKLRAASD